MSNGKTLARLNARLVELKLNDLTAMCDVTDPEGAFWAEDPQLVLSSLKALLEASRLAVKEINETLK